MRPIFATLLALFATSLNGAEPYVPPVGPEIETITVTSGNVGLMLRRNTQWTPGRLDFHRAPMTTERSAYGTVFKFPGVGFIGTGHFENEPEALKSVRFFVNDEEVQAPMETFTAERFRFERDSMVRGISLQNTIELKDGHLYESTTVSSEKVVPLDLVYHFMHAWLPEMTHFSTGQNEVKSSDAGEFESAEETIGKFYINEHVDWIAVYHAPTGRFAVSHLIESPEEAAAISMLWNRPPAYRKYYHRSFFNQPIPAGFSGTWKMVTAFGKASVEDWQLAAEKLASDLQNELAKTLD